MYPLDFKRCQHCLGWLAAVPLHEAEEFGRQGPGLVCERCDRPPPADETMHVPDDWI